MSIENKGFDYNGCHVHEAEQRARIAGMYSNGPAIFEKAKEEKALQAKEKEEGDDDEEEEDETDAASTSETDTVDEGLDEKTKIKKSAYQTLGITYEPAIQK